jgi:hypothetical protein
MKKPSKLLLEFKDVKASQDNNKKLIEGLSAVVQIGDTLWVANDEMIGLERLSLVKMDNEDSWAAARDHRHFPLQDFIDLPAPPSPRSDKIEEVDIEGLAYGDGYLWLIGSHSLKRKNPTIDDEGDFEKARKQLARVSRDGNRYLLARVPVEQDGGSYTLKREAVRDDHRTAAVLKGDEKGNELTDALKDDEHLAPFLDIPGKDNGFDIEGLAVAGDRLFIGLRGPVLRGWAVILEVELKEDDPPFQLELKKIGPDGRPYLKHFLQLGDLGVRDLCVQGKDLLILAGPSMNLAGPFTIFRWPGGAEPNGECMVRTTELVRVMDLPDGKQGDRAEGIALIRQGADIRESLLVVYDAVTASRQKGEWQVEADVFELY